MLMANPGVDEVPKQDFIQESAGEFCLNKC